MQLEFSYKYKWNCSSHVWVQKKKYLEQFGVFQFKKKLRNFKEEKKK